MYLKRIQRIITNNTGIDPEDITPASYFEDDLNIGEVEFAEIISELEEQYNIGLGDYINDIETVEDLVTILSEELD